MYSGTNETTYTARFKIEGFITNSMVRKVMCMSAGIVDRQMLQAHGSKVVD